MVCSRHFLNFYVWQRVYHFWHNGVGTRLHVAPTRRSDGHVTSKLLPPRFRGVSELIKSFPLTFTLGSYPPAPSTPTPHPNVYDINTHSTDSTTNTDGDCRGWWARSHTVQRPGERLDSRQFTFVDLLVLTSSCRKPICSTDCCFVRCTFSPRPISCRGTALSMTTLCELVLRLSPWPLSSLDSGTYP